MSYCYYAANGTFSCPRRFERFQDTETRPSTGLATAPSTGLATGPSTAPQAVIQNVPTPEPHIQIKFMQDGKTRIDWKKLTESSYTNSEWQNVYRKQPYGTVLVKAVYSDGTNAVISVKTTSRGEDVVPWKVLTGRTEQEGQAKIYVFSKTQFNEFISNNKSWGTIHWRVDYPCEAVSRGSGNCIEACRNAGYSCSNGVTSDRETCSCLSHANCKVPF